MPSARRPRAASGPAAPHAPGSLPPLDAAIAPHRPGVRVAPVATSLSSRAAEVLEAGPADAATLMRAVCRLDRLQPEAAARMAEVLLGQRAEFVQLDDDRWALVREGRVVEATAGTLDPATDDSPAAPDALATLRFAVVDVETTGSQAGLWDRVTEIAIVPVDAGVVGAPWSQLVHPGRAIPPMITALTGISDAMVADAPSFQEIAPEVVARLEGRVFVAHNAAFDRRFVSAELARAAGLGFDGDVLCTVRLTRRLVPALSRRSLDRVCHYFGIRIADRHRAGGDALATAHVLVRLLGIAEDVGLRRWHDLQRSLSTGPSRARRVRRSGLPSPVREDPFA